MNLNEYLLNFSQEQDPVLQWLQKQTNLRTNHARMLCGPVEGKLIEMISGMIRPKNILEIGAFTGYSATCMASVLPADGHLDTLELNDELEDLILEGFEKAGVENKVQLHIGDCKETLVRLRSEMGLGNAGGDVDTSKMYDIVYIDANKREYCEYYDLVFDMVRSGGLILADNVIWDGKVCMDPLPQDKQTLEIVRFNDKVTADPRVESVILPLRDGLNVIRKK